MNDAKIYVPMNAKAIKTPKGTHILKLSCNVEKLCAFLKEHANDKGWINMGVTARKDTGKYGETHSVWLDTWKPEQKPGHATTQAKTTDDDTSEVPF